MNDLASHCCSGSDPGSSQEDARLRVAHAAAEIAVCCGDCGLARGQGLESRPLGERLGAHRREHVVGRAELPARVDAPVLAAHMDVNAIDLAGAPANAVTELQVAAADNLKRVVRPEATDWARTPGPQRMLAFLETKTVWHPIGV